MELISENEIREYCIQPLSYERGDRLYQEGAVNRIEMEVDSARKLSFKCNEVDGEDDRYNVSFELIFDEDRSSKISDYMCNCRAYQQYEGFCKHIVAAMLQTNKSASTKRIYQCLNESRVGEVRVIKEEKFQTDLTQEKKTKPENKGNRKTSKELLDVLQQLSIQERNRFCRELANGDVKLEGILHIEKNDEKLEFAIGRDKMYVIKDVRELVAHIRKQDRVYYGKKLEFVHTQSAFDRSSIELVSMLLGMEFPKKTLYSYGKPSYDSRYVSLSRRELDRFMELKKGKSVQVVIDIDDETDNVQLEVPVVSGNPRLPVYIKGNDDHSASVRLPEIMLMEGYASDYVYYGDTIYVCTENFREEMSGILRLMCVNNLRSEREEAKLKNWYYGLYDRRKADLFLSEADYASFCTTLLPVLERYTELSIANVDFSEHQAAEGKYEIYLDVSGRDIVCEAQATYGELKHNLIIPASNTETYRDVREEYVLRLMLEKYFTHKTPDGNKYLIRDTEDDELADLVGRGVEQLKEYAEVYVSDAFRRIKISEEIKVTTGLSIKGNLLEVSWDADGMSKDELYKILGAYSKKKKFYRLKNGELLDLGAAGIDVMARMKEELQLTKTDLKNGNALLPEYRAIYIDSLMRQNADRISVNRDELFENMMTHMEETRNKKYEIPENIKAELRDYQKDGYRWAMALSELGFGGILADDMGLGKTLQMITFISAKKNSSKDAKIRTIVICPASLVYNWEAEFTRFAPDIKVSTIVGNAQERLELIEKNTDFDVIITSYDLLRRDIECYNEIEFDYQIIDEAQYIKNPGTQIAKAVKSLKSHCRFALTGTPIENRLSELWSIFEYLMPGYLYSYNKFRACFEVNIFNDNEEAKTASDRLSMMIGPFILRRLKSDVLTDLPDKLEEVVYSGFNEEQEKLYRAQEKNILINLKGKSEDELRNKKIEILAELMRLRQVCCDPHLIYDNYKGESAKLNTCIELIINAIAGGHKILLFSQFASMIDIIEQKLSEKSIRCFKLVGATPKSKRRDMVERFQNGEAEVFLISLKAGGTGLNLTAADIVIHYDPWWNQAVEEQAADRAHRIGQEKKVTVYKLIAKNTIEERIVKLQEKKRELADKIISSENIAIAQLDREDIFALFEEW